MEKENNISKIIETSIENIESTLNTERILGKQIINEKGQTIIPVSQVTVGILGGGGEYGEVKLAKEAGKNFAGGSATICSIKPSCFIIDNGDGFFVTNESGDTSEKLIRLLIGLISKLKK